MADGNSRYLGIARARTAMIARGQAPQERAGFDVATPPFCRAGYRVLIESFLAAGYEIATFDSVRPERRDLVLRHDIDVSLEAAVDIAQLERELGIRATYFVMISNSFYNIHSYEGRRSLVHLRELGHDVGLHFDTTHYMHRGRDHFVKAIHHELGVLEAVVDNPIPIVSFHNPAPELINRERTDGLPAHTYEPRFFRDLTYVADSGGEWRFGGPFERDAFRARTAIHLLTHPIWWAHDDPGADAITTLNRYTANHMTLLDESLARGFKQYRERRKDRRDGTR